MQLIRSLYNISSKAQEAVLTIGNFDGVHLGHQTLIKQVVMKAKALNKPSMVITFEPHPFEFFHQTNIPARLTRLREKYSQIAKLQLDYLLVLPFNQQLAALPAPDFIQQILYQSLHPTYILIGDDFHFGAGRKGNFQLLADASQKLNFGVEAIETFNLLGERVSSSRIRQLLLRGELSLAKQLLGRPYSMQGRVRGGDKRGRMWGFPTANIFLHRKVTPMTGIFTVLVHGIQQTPLQGVANLGVRPTINGTRTLLEVHLLDFNQDIYGYYVEVEFCKKLREEIRYPDIDSLIKQIAQDVIDAKEYFLNNGVSNE